MATTQTVTVLFTDLVGSTELSSRLGPEAADALRQTHFGLLRGAIQTAGGTEVKNLGDGLMVVFTSLSRALACGVAMQQAIERHNRRDEGAALSVRIGISVGEATEDDGDYFGTPVIEASRLCAKADGGQILAAEMVKAMAGGHATQEFVSVGDLELKGLPQPVPSVEVVWEPEQVVNETGSGHFPLPARLVGASAESLFAFFGRADELTRLTDTQKASAAENRLRVVLISGEPGIGKTTLVAQAARSAHVSGANILYGNCEEGLGVPYQPWITALSQLIDQADEELLRAFVESKGLSLARLLPDLARRVSMDPPSPGSDADSERFLILEGVARLLALASTSTPLVVVLDDLHWVDAATLQLLRHLVASPIPMSVLVVGTFRESDLSRSHPLTGALADLRREDCVHRIDLQGLEDTEIIDLLEAAAGQTMADEGVGLAHALRRETGGNPFFLVEVIRHLNATGAFVQDDQGQWALSTDLDALSLPTSVREVVAHRVARLGEETEQALSMAAVIGRDFDLDVLSGLLDIHEDRLLDLLEGAVGAGLVSESEDEAGRYRFLHALIQHTLYQDLGATRRQRAHQRVAEALETRGAQNEYVTELARHFMAATRPSDVTKAVYYARLAGDVALAAYAPLDAVAWYTQALELAARQSAPDDRRQCELLLRLGGAQLQFDPAVGFETLRQAGDVAEAIGAADLLITWAHIRPPGWRTSEPPDPDRLRRLNQVLAVIDPGDHALRARLLAAVAEEIDPAQWRRRRQVADEAVAAAMEADDDATTVDVIMSTSFITLAPDRAHENFGLAKKVLAITETRPDPVTLAGSLHFMMTASLVVGDVDAARRAVDRLGAVAEAYGSPLVMSLLHQAKVCLDMLDGDLDDLERQAEKMLTLGLGAGMPAMVAAYGGALFEMRWAQGRLAEIADMAAAALDDLPSYSGFRAAVVVVYCAIGQLDLARAVFAPEAAADFAEFPFDQIWLACMALFSEGAVALGDSDAQATLYERLVPFADLHAAGGPIFYGSMQRPVGRLAASLGRSDEAEDHLRRALAEHRRIGASFWLARTAVELAEVLLDVPSSSPDGGQRRQEALSLLQEARQLAVNRYGEVAARAEQLMAGPGMAGS
jgi:class 3 adenylate cyclase/tetratricopeptide (TPR) repeat protein